MKIAQKILKFSATLTIYINVKGRELWESFGNLPAIYIYILMVQMMNISNINAAYGAYKTYAVNALPNSGAVTGSAAPELTATRKTDTADFNFASALKSAERSLAKNVETPPPTTKLSALESIYDADVFPVDTTQLANAILGLI
jgi:hypothetical protein